MTRHIELVIDALVLEGFDPADRHAIAGGVSAELARLVQCWNPVTRAFDRSHVVAPPVHALPALRPSSIGERIASALHAALSGSHSGAQER